MPGSERLRLALQRLEASGNPEAWLKTAMALHARESSDVEWAAVSARIEAWRGGLRSVGGRIWAAQVTEELTSQLVREQLRSDAGDAGAVLAVTETLRTRTLLDEIALESRPLPPALAAQVDEIEDELMRLTQGSPSDPIRRELMLLSELVLNREPHEGYARLRVEDLERMLGEVDGGLVGTRRVAELAEVQAALAPGELLVSYFIPFWWSHPAIELWAIAITTDGATVAECPLADLPGDGNIGRISFDGNTPIDMSPLGALVAGTRVAIQRVQEDTADAALTGLDAVLLEPLRAVGAPVDASNAIIVAPHRMLHAVPWPALRNPSGSRLVETAAVGLCPSASVLTALRERPATAPTSYLGMADPPLGAELPRLEQARNEVSDVRDRLEPAGVRCVVLEDEGATEAALRRRGPGSSIVHLATHGTFPGQDAFDAHALRLAPDGDHDGVVRADELRSIDFSQTWLALLSVCDGGLVRFGPSGEPYGLVRALLVAGCQNVHAALWKVDDTAGRELNVAFAGGLAAATPVAALAGAVTPLIASRPTVEWAAFVTIGACR